MRFVDEYRDPAAARPWWRGSPSWPATATSSSWRCAGATPTRSTATASSTSSRPRSSWCTGPGARCASSRWAASTTPSPWPRRPGVIFTSFGDMMRVPGSNGNLLAAKARGADVRFVYSPLDALRVAVGEPRAPGRVLRRRLRDHGALDGRDAPAGQGRTGSRTSASSPTTSRSSPRSRPSSSPPTCASTGSSGRATCRRWSASARTASCPRCTASRSSRRASSRSTSCRRSPCS